MFRFGTGFGLLKCPLSEFNDDIHGEDNLPPSELNDDLYVEDDDTFPSREEEKKSTQNKKITSKKKLRSKKRTFQEQVDLER